MTRIEKTQINTSAFMVLSSTLKKVQSDNIIEILEGGTKIIIRPKTESEKHDFTIDLSFLDKILWDFMKGNPGVVVFTGEDEQYIRNCSYACYYYREENHIIEQYDHFDLFHKIHFTRNSVRELSETIADLFCGLFRIDFDICKPFLKSAIGIESKMDLPSGGVFNEYFKTALIKKEENALSLKFESKTLDYGKSLDALFTIKDLLCGQGIDTKQIPEINSFFISEDETKEYVFHLESGSRVIITYRFNFLSVEFQKEC